MIKKAHGFTIVELLIVIVVIAILATVSIVTYSGIQKRARDSLMASSLSNAYRAVKVAAVDGQLPANLNSIMTAPTGMSLGYVPDQATGSFCISIAAQDGTARKIDGAGVQTEGAICNAIQGASVIAANSTTHTSLPRITDGSIGTSAESWSSYYEGSGGSSSWVRIDLGTPRQISMIQVWHFYFDGRTYANPRVEVSADGTTWTTVYAGGAYKETAAGRVHAFSPQTVRYIRDTISGSTANAGNHWVEIQAS